MICLAGVAADEYLLLLLLLQALWHQRGLFSPRLHQVGAGQPCNVPAWVHHLSSLMRHRHLDPEFNWGNVVVICASW
jgi:hypothetical protein